VRRPKSRFKARAKQIRLHLLGFGELFVFLFQDFLKIGDLFRFLVQVVGQCKPGFFGFVSGDFSALQLHPLGHLGFEGVFCLGQRGLAVLNCFFAPGNVEVFLRQPLFKIAAGGFDERRGQRFRQLDLIFAFRTDDGWFGHKHSSSFGVRVHLTQNHPPCRKILDGNGCDLNRNGVAANPRPRRAVHK
jgi:hypothetical protein